MHASHRGVPPHVFSHIEYVLLYRTCSLHTAHRGVPLHHFATGPARDLPIASLLPAPAVLTEVCVRGMRKCQKRPTQTAKEAHLDDTRDLFRRQKRPIEIRIPDRHFLRTVPVRGPAWAHSRLPVAAAARSFPRKVPLSELCMAALRPVWGLGGWVCVCVCVCVCLCVHTHMYTHMCCFLYRRTHSIREHILYIEENTFYIYHIVERHLRQDHDVITHTEVHIAEAIGATDRRKVPSVVKIYISTVCSKKIYIYGSHRSDRPPKSTVCSKNKMNE